MRPITLNQFEMQNIGPRGRNIGDCVVRALTFICRPRGEYDDLEALVLREQSHYNPNAINTGGVVLSKFMRQERKLFGKMFTRVGYINTLPQDFIRRFYAGTYLVANDNHAYVVKEGDIFDGNPTRWNKPIVDAWRVIDAA